MAASARKVAIVTGSTQALAKPLLDGSWTKISSVGW
jgi:hypothetical protein